MKKFNKLALGAALVFGAAAFSSCTEKAQDISGVWTASAPETVVPAIQGATSATAITTIEFKDSADAASGPVTITKDYTVSLPDSTGTIGQYTVKASISGTWTREAKEKDDYTIAFDQNSLSVAGTDVPDGLGTITDNFLGTIGQYTVLDDVEVSKDGKTLKMELENPDIKVSFTKM